MEFPLCLSPQIDSSADMLDEDVTSPDSRVGAASVISSSADVCIGLDVAQAENTVSLPDWHLVVLN